MGRTPKQVPGHQEDEPQIKPLALPSLCRLQPKS